MRVGRRLDEHELRRPGAHGGGDGVGVGAVDERDVDAEARAGAWSKSAVVIENSWRRRDDVVARRAQAEDDGA